MPNQAYQLAELLPRLYSFSNAIKALAFGNTLC